MYYNYKQFHSSVFLALCGARYAFTYVNIGSYGGMNDASIFNRSKLHEELQNGTFPSPVPENSRPYFILGDDIFPLKPWLMKPYSGKDLSFESRVFNYRLSRARRTIENSFGILAARWRIFRRPVRANISTVDDIIKATLCLHNYLIKTENARYSPSGFVDCYDGGELEEREWRNVVEGDNGMGALQANHANNYSFDAKMIRDNLREYVNSVDGSVAWQNETVSYCGRKT
ncbi:protein ALP1-like [Anneissia japonica]|uniref:protein ALP1-like n=1 Tax=Anneissia japonica TaxID=1529436 RepID=UPI001425B56A|nr:protein ALP1-like [Anneissia japonica]